MWLTSIGLQQNSLFKQMERMGLKEPYRRGSHGEYSDIPQFSKHITSWC